MILVGSVLKRYKDNSNYHIEMEGQHRQIMKRMRIENLANFSDKTQSKKSIHPWLIPITHDECLQSMTGQGYEVLYDLCREFVIVNFLLLLCFATLAYFQIS